MSSEDDIFGWNSWFFFCACFFFPVYMATPPPDVPPLREAVKHMQKAYCLLHTHTHTHAQRSLGGGTSADLLWNKPGAMIAEARQPSTCMVFLSRVKHCCQKQLCVCALVCVCVVGREGANVSEKRMCSEITDNVPSAHGRVYEWHWTTAVRNYCIVIKWLLPHWQPY